MTARNLGNVVPYGKVDGLPRIIVKKINLANPLGGIASTDLFRPRALAYEDGYADGRTYGESGKFISTSYGPQEVYQYAAGFKAGCRVREAYDSMTQALIHNQEVSVASESLP